MGGMIGMTFALKHPGRFSSLVLVRYFQPGSARGCARLGRTHQDRRGAGHGAAGRADAAALVYRTVLQSQQADDGAGRTDDSRPPTGPGYIGCCHAIPKINLTDRLGAITCPVQVIVGDQDVGTPVAMSRAIQDAIPGSELVIIPSASHLSNLEQPEAFNKALPDFLGRQA